MNIIFDEYDTQSLSKIHKRRETSGSFEEIFYDLSDIEVSTTEARKELKGVENYLNRKLELANKDVEIAQIKYKESIEINKDGTQISDKLIEMNEQQMKDPIYMLRAHGYSEKSFELLNVKNNFWNVYSKQDGIQTLYSSKITVKPIVQQFDIEWSKEVFKELKPLDKVKIYDEESNGNLIVLHYADLHIGVRGLEYEQEIKDMTDRVVLKCKNAKTILLTLGNDFLNSNNMDGATSITVKGTGVESALDYSEMFKSGLRTSAYIIDRLIEETKEAKTKIDVVYVVSNHDQYSMFGVFQSLMQRYISNENISFDDSMEMRKYFQYGKVGIGLSHGFSEGKRIFGLFPIESPQIFANTTCREFHLGHLHNESVKDDTGVMFRRLPTVNENDKWHKNLGFVGATKRIQLFEYDTELGELEGIKYFYLNKN